MAKGLLSEEQFSRVVVTRVRRERPDIRVKPMDRFLLLVEAEPGHSRVVSLGNLYQAYCECPTSRDAVIGAFLENLVYDEPPTVDGDFAGNRRRVMPQVVPPSLLEFCRQDGRELAAVDYVGNLSITFVMDEPERYSYIHRKAAEQWGVCDTDLLAAALENLQALHRETPALIQIGTGERTTLVWETFDGYDASRILLTRELNTMAALVPGNPIIGIPHRDYLVMFGDSNPAFVAEMAERIRLFAEGHSYPITSQLFTLVDGNLAVYEPGRRQRLVN